MTTSLMFEDSHLLLFVFQYLQIQFSEFGAFNMVKHGTDLMWEANAHGFGVHSSLPARSSVDVLPQNAAHRFLIKCGIFCRYSLLAQIYTRYSWIFYVRFNTPLCLISELEDLTACGCRHKMGFNFGPRWLMRWHAIAFM